MDTKVLFGFLVHKKQPVPISSVPEKFKKDLDNFMFGKTITKTKDGFAYYPVDFNEWVSKVITQGLGYDIDLKRP